MKSSVFVADNLHGVCASNVGLATEDNCLSSFVILDKT